MAQYPADGIDVSRGSVILSLVKELWAFLRIRKKWWLAPILIIKALFGSLIVFTHGSALAPFVYTIF